MLEFIAKGNCEINIFTDSNIDINKCRNLDTRRYKEMLKRFGLVNKIQEVTHIVNGGQGFSAIDHILTTNPGVFNYSGTIPCNASDHFPIFGVRKKPYANHDKVKIKCRAYSKVNYDKLNEEISSKDWTSVLMLQTPKLLGAILKKFFLLCYINMHHSKPIIVDRTHSRGSIMNFLQAQMNEMKDKN